MHENAEQPLWITSIPFLLSLNIIIMHNKPTNRYIHTDHLGFILWRSFFRFTKQMNERFFYGTRVFSDLMQITAYEYSE